MTLSTPENLPRRECTSIKKRTIRSNPITGKLKALDDVQTGRCDCGKLSFVSEQAAKDVVFEARISRVIRHNSRRKEDRHYQCRYGAWHTTSLGRMNATRMAS